MLFFSNLFIFLWVFVIIDYIIKLMKIFSLLERVFRMICNNVLEAIGNTPLIRLN